MFWKLCARLHVYCMRLEVEQWWQDFLSPRRDQARSACTYSIAPNVVSFSFSVILYFPLSLFRSFFLVLSRFPALSQLYVYASRSSCVTFAACASTKLNAGKPTARNISQRNVHLSCSYRGTRSVFEARPVSEISKTVRKYVGVKATKVCCETTTEIKVRGTWTQTSFGYW